ncbi:MAG: endolytic transglycosylase MltG [Eubacteriales bacterium]|nr:endolytic transglycosylase MltG [Eubacteriales bacterium]
MSIGRVVRNILFFIGKMVLIVVIVMGLYRFGSYAYDFGYQIYSGRGVNEAPGRDVAVVISEGQSVSSIAGMLMRQGLIRDEKVFLVQERLSKYHGMIQAGNYVLNTSMSGEQMISILSGHPLEDESGD